MIGGAFLTDAAQTVIIAHDPLNHRDIAVLTVVSQQIAHGVAVKKERVEVRAFRADDPAVEHGVDVIRAALKGARVQPPALQKRLDETRAKLNAIE